VEDYIGNVYYHTIKKLVRLVRCACPSHGTSALSILFEGEGFKSRTAEWIDDTVRRGEWVKVR
jgi:hypothetical protein